MMGREWKWTIRSFCMGLFTMAVVINLTALLLVALRDEFSLTFEMVARLFLINFTVQMAVDLIAGALSTRVNARILLVAGTIFTFLGFVGFCFLPQIMSNPYAGLVIAVVLIAMGSGVYEMLTSPLVNAIPSDTKTQDMAFLHSFYAWGAVILVISSTVIFFIIGYFTSPIPFTLDNLAAIFYQGLKYWKVLPLLWAIPTFALIFLFANVKLPKLIEEEKRQPLKRIILHPYMILMLLAICLGAMVENIGAQWVSAFAELGLGIDKFIGDILAMALFFTAMALTRSWFGKFGERVNMAKFLVFCAVLSIVCYLTACLSPSIIISVVALVTIGFSSAMMWPGALTLNARYFPLAGAPMFAIMAFAGDGGAGVGPWLAGFFADHPSDLSRTIFNFFGHTNLTNDALSVRNAMLMSAIFPVVLLIVYLIANKVSKKNRNI